MKINEVIVVEGKKDTLKVKQAVNADTIETNGSAVSESTLDMILHAQQKRGVIVFTDPDYPGQRIRHIIEAHVPACKHAFIQKEKADSGIPTKSVGVEHASISAIQEALLKVRDTNSGLIETDIKKSDLMKHGLIGTQAASARREALGNTLHIGYTNGKQLLNRLQMFGITQKELNQAMLHILERGETDE